MSAPRASTRNAAALLFAAGLTLTACYDLRLPTPAGPGSIQGRALYATPGSSALSPAVGARVELRGTSITVVITDEDGRFVLPSAGVTGGVLLFSFDSDRDGKVDRQRLLQLSNLGLVAGRDLALGDVVLGKNARATGTVRGKDVAAQGTGHAGTSVVVDGTGTYTLSGDNGGFVLPDLPEGELRVSFFRPGYAPEVIQLQLRAGEDARLTDVLLERTSDTRPASVRGTVRATDGALLADVSVRSLAAGREATARTDSAGAFKLDGLTPGVASLAFEKSGFTSAELRGVLLLPGENTLAPVVLAAGTSSTVNLDAGPVEPPTDAGSDAGSADAGPTDAGPSDAGATDAGPADAGPTDAGPTDAGPTDAGPTDAGPIDAGPTDAGPIDAGPTDAGPTDAGPPDAGPPDAGAPDAGPPDAGLPGIPLPALAQLLASGWVLLPDGGLLGADGGTGVGDGGTGLVLPAGSFLLGDGSVLLPDGRRLLPGGVVVLPDGGLGLLDAGVDAGATLDCRGACSAGFQCTAQLECQTPVCALMSCGGVCQSGRCYADRCSGAPTACAPGDVCDGTQCVPLACAGVPCGGGYACANGRCLPTTCALGSCGQAEVCVSGQCVHARCVDVSCELGTVCLAGVCTPTASGTTVCSAGQVYFGGRCVDPSCVNVSCPAATTCQAGRCVSAGLIVAGFTYPYGLSHLGTIGAVAESTPTGWRKLNVTSLPRIIQLGTSPDSSWLYALGDDGALRRSTDGVLWATVWSGTIGVNGLISHFSVDPTSGELVVAIYGNNDVTRFERSTDNGSTFSFLFKPPQGLVRGTAQSSAPGYFQYWHDIFGDENRAVTLRDGGVVFNYPSSYGAGQLAFDPTGWGPTLLGAGSRVAFIDGGLSGSFQACGSACFVYAPAPSQRINAASTNSVWISRDHGQSWGSRTTTAPTTLSLSALVAGADGTLYASNRNGTPPLIRSTDEGETWSPAGQEFQFVEGLADGFDPWQPDASYPSNNTVQPRAVNGHVYQRSGGSNPWSGPVEPLWPIDGGFVTDTLGSTWQDRGLVNLLRVTAMTTRVCGLGRMQCGGACVDVTTDSAHCGGCNSPCAGQCLAGRCNDVDAGVLATAGCADGTREGFGDVARYPNLAACAGRWTGDLTDPAADALCSAGFHVCTHADTEPRVVDFVQATAFPGCFAYRASNDDFDGCEPLVCHGDVRHDDMAGMGRGCTPVSGASWPRTAADAGTCLAGNARLDAQCCAASVALPGQSRSAGCLQRGESGVVCCRD